MMQYHGAVKCSKVSTKKPANVGQGFGHFKFFSNCVGTAGNSQDHFMVDCWVHRQTAECKMCEDVWTSRCECALCWINKTEFLLFALLMFRLVMTTWTALCL
jgi:hypothetical protein